MLSKNHTARLKRVRDRIDRSLDSLMQANGELWPKELRHHGGILQDAVLRLQELSRNVSEHLELGEPEGRSDAPVAAEEGDLSDVLPEDEEAPPPGSPASRRRAAPEEFPTTRRRGS